MSGLAVIVLAAGKGTRMRSRLPKVLHAVCGLPMAAHVLDAARELEPERLIVVIGHEAELVRAALAAPDVAFVEQTQLLGTADAVKRCKEAAGACDEVMVLNGDSPLITPETLRGLLAARGSAALSFATCRVPDVGSFGRVVRNDAGAVREVLEQSDINNPSKLVERNAGQYVFEAAWLWNHVAGIPASSRGEYYLTYLQSLAYVRGRPAVAFEGSTDELMGFDDRVGLADAERLMRERILRRHMLAGVTITDPATTYIDAVSTIEEDVTLLPGCHITGASQVATGCVIGPSTTLRNARLGENTIVRQSAIEDSIIGARVNVGPFAHTRGGAVIGDDCELGNYSEVKNSNIGNGVKMHHFSYLGDADVGDRANIGAGTITCNYDGVAKNRTSIGADAFLGCDTMLVAPITIGAGAMTAAGAVVTKDVPAGTRVAGVPARLMAPKAEGLGAL